VIEVAGYKFRNKHDVEVLAAIAKGEDPKVIAAREGVTVNAIYERRRAYEVATGLKLPRTDRR
jgi:hypothetical protein